MRGGAQLRFIGQSTDAFEARSSSIVFAKGIALWLLMAAAGQAQGDVIVESVNRSVEAEIISDLVGFDQEVCTFKREAPEEIIRISTDAGLIVGGLKRFDGTRRYLIVFNKPEG